jgi:hypothetical protein
MIEKGDYVIQDIATKIAKSEKFILQRLSLNNLNAEWKKLFFKNEINLSKALIIARLDKKYQKEVAQNASDWSGGIKSAKQLQSYIDSNITALLSKAIFNPKDEKLMHKAGACTNCPKRSGANCSLFPDVQEEDRCFDNLCFDSKTEKHIQIEIDRIIHNAENVHLIKSKHQAIDDDLSEKLKKLDVNVLVVYDDFETFHGEDKRKTKSVDFGSTDMKRDNMFPSNGVPIETVSKLLGHSKLSTTQVYARVMEQKLSSDIRDLKDRLNNKQDLDNQQVSIV